MKETVKDLKHFSHEHPLEYINSRLHEICQCSCCNLTVNPNQLFYQCKICQFSLHKVCYNMPRKVVHPVDSNHHLSLIAPSPSCPKNECGACGAHIGGFYYTCAECSLYFHALCVAMPLSVKIPSSHNHVLELEVEPPYEFQCDLCDKPSFCGWLYRCRLCEFDAHISCTVNFKESDQSHIYCTEDDRVKDSKTHENELMELLSDGMKGIQINPDKSIDQCRFRRPLDHQPLDHSIMVSEDFTLPSYHFSDACFSIDIANSIGIDGKTNEAKFSKGQSFGFGKKELKRELTLAPSPGINSHVWKDIGQDFEKGSSKSTNERMQLKDRATRMEIVNSRRPFWSKFLMCS